MTSLPTPYAAAQIAEFLDGHLSWSAWWDKHDGLWRVAEDDPDSDLYAASRDADVVIRYMRQHSRGTGAFAGTPAVIRQTNPDPDSSIPVAPTQA